MEWGPQNQKPMITKHVLCICLKIFDIIMNYFHHATFMKLHLYTANHYMYILYNACKNSYQENSQVNHANYC